MPVPIAPLPPPAGIESILPIPASGPSQKSGTAFQSMLTDAIGNLQQTQQANQQVIGGFLNGENEEVHQVALAAQETELQFDLFMQVRNKIVSAYQEVMKMQM